MHWLRRGCDFIQHQSLLIILFWSTHTPPRYRKTCVCMWNWTKTLSFSSENVPEALIEVRHAFYGANLQCAVLPIAKRHKFGVCQSAFPGAVSLRVERLENQRRTVKVIAQCAIRFTAAALNVWNRLGGTVWVALECHKFNSVCIIALKLISRSENMLALAHDDSMEIQVHGSMRRWSAFIILLLLHCEAIKMQMRLDGKMLVSERHK